MKLYMYAYRNAVGNFYSSPFNSGDDVDIAAEKFARMLYAADDKQLDSVSDDELYLIGVFDDSTGEVTPCSQFVVNMGSLVKQVRLARAVKDDEDGNEEKSNS